MVLVIFKVIISLVLSFGIYSYLVEDNYCQWRIIYQILFFLIASGILFGLFSLTIWLAPVVMAILGIYKAYNEENIGYLFAWLMAAALVSLVIIWKLN